MSQERAQETPLVERLRLLHQALDSTREKVQSQGAALDKLRRDLDSYRSLIGELSQRTSAAEAAAAVLPPLTAAPPALAALPAPAAMPITTRSRWAAALPYAALAACGLALSIAMPWRRAAARPSLKVAQIPAPEIVAAIDTQTLADEASNGEVLGLIYRFIPPGGMRSVLDVLGPEIESAKGSSPWVFVRVDSRTTLVSFRPYGDVIETAPVYEFVVDRLAKAVTASPETIQNLRTGSLASR